MEVLDGITVRSGRGSFCRFAIDGLGSLHDCEIGWRIKNGY